MHEYSVARSLMQVIESNAAEHHATAIHSIHLRVGELAGIEVELLSSAFDMVREHTVCADAEVEIVTCPVQWQCSLCGRPIATGTALRCPDCAAPARMMSGDEIMLDRLEMEIP